MPTTDAPLLNPTVTQPPPQSAPSPKAAQFASLQHNLSLALLVVCPIIILLPPRKLDLYTFGLGGLWIASAAHTARVSTRRGLGDQVAVEGGYGVPTERAREVQRILREQKEARRKADEAAGKVAAKKPGVLEKLWMGGETEGWKERRLREEQEALSQGKGYGDLIKEQIWDVWGVDKGTEDQKEKDRLEETKKEGNK